MEKTEATTPGFQGTQARHQSFRHTSTKSEAAEKGSPGSSVRGGDFRR